uniref:SCY domain-containing protein n=1 Tax=Strongyloides papillosus TaxID=174720 RepID=A0A0N5BMB5_STREA
MSLKETHRRHSIRKNRHPTYVITEVIKKGERGYMCNRQFFRTLQGANDCLMKLNKKHKRLVRSRPAPTIPPRSHSHRTPPPYQKPPPYRSRIPLKPLRSLSPPPIPPRPANRLQKKY